MQVLFSFKTIAIAVRHWFEVTRLDEEHGCRVELRLLAPPPHRGTESAAQMIVLDQPVWRVDIFDVIGAEPGNLARAHYHPGFAGVEPSERHRDDGLKNDPINWITDRLADIGSILRQSNVDHSIDPDEQSLVNDHVEEVALAIRSRLGVHCRTPGECLWSTADVAHLVPRMYMDLRSTTRALDPRVGRDGWNEVVEVRALTR